MKSYVCWAAISIAALPLARANSQDHPFSVKDDIAMIRFSDPSSEHSVAGREIVKPSPDGKHFALVTTRGLLDSDQIESKISIFDLNVVSAFLEAATGKPPKPRIIATIVSFPHREQTVAYAPVIKNLYWSPDGTSVYFRGENSKGAYQLYIAKLDGGGFHALTPENDSVDRFDIANNTIVYTASQEGKDHVVQGETINQDARAVTGYRIQDVLFPDQMGAYQPETLTMSLLRVAHGQWRNRQVPGYSVLGLTTLSYFFPFTLSPKGDKLIGLIPVSTVPDLWKNYEPATGYEHMRFHADDPRLTSADNILRPQEYSLIDLASGRKVSLVDAPNARSLEYNLDISRVSWAADERRVLVTNTFMRFDQKDGVEPLQRKWPCAVASVDLPSLNASCLFFAGRQLQPATLHVQDVSFGVTNDDAVVLLKHGSKEQIVQRYHFQDGKWSMASSAPVSGAVDRLSDLRVPKGGSLQVSIRQSLNDPPTLWVSNSETGEARQLWDPNPQFRHIRFGDVSVYHWRDNTGYEWTGGLVKPIDYVAGNRYPLVVQMYQFVDDQFLTDGTDPTAFAARHLASAGFVVLQIRKKPNTLSEADPQGGLEGYRSAVESLSKAGLVDRSRVGVVGFSWTCWYAVNALIKEPKLFAAATIADGLDNSYMQYLIFGVGAAIVQEQMERIRGASPFGAGLRQWMEEAPGFHLDQVQVPVRIEAMNPGSVLQEWELYSSLRMQNKPVDFIYFPHGTHIHQKPSERLESQQGNVDWFRFWLQNYEDPDPSKHAQYERWRRLKSDLHRSPTIAANN